MLEQADEDVRLGGELASRVLDGGVAPTVEEAVRTLSSTQDEEPDNDGEEQKRRPASKASEGWKRLTNPVTRFCRCIQAVFASKPSTQPGLTAVNIELAPPSAIQMTAGMPLLLRGPTPYPHAAAYPTDARLIRASPRVDSALGFLRRMPETLGVEPLRAMEVEWMTVCNWLLSTWKRARRFYLELREKGILKRLWYPSHRE